MSQIENLTGLLDQLSEASLNDLRIVLMRRVRRQSLQVKAGNDPDDLATLKLLQDAVIAIHAGKLES